LEEVHGFVPAKNWAFLIAAVIKQKGWLPSIYASYKLQDIPQADFKQQVYDCFVDIVKGDCYKDVMNSSMEGLVGLLGKFIDMDRANDLALIFDTRIWKVACELGFEVDDYSSRPALTYLVGDGEVVISRARCHQGGSPTMTSQAT